jgi:glyoxylase-like metal-dependent hydrolase (beta-lactamase superfamily II)
VEIATGVHQISGMPISHAFLLVGERLTLVDTGTPGSAGAIEGYIRRLGRSPEELELIVLTHYHDDHKGAVSRLRQGRSIRVAAGAADIPYVEGKLLQPRASGVGIQQLFHRLVHLFMKTEPTSVELSLGDGQELEASVPVQVIRAPGHTPGSICLYLPTTRTLLVGDAVSYRGGGRLGLPNAAFTPHMAEARRSIARLAALDVEAIGFGHGGPLKSGGTAALRDLAARCSG